MSREARVSGGIRILSLFQIMLIAATWPLWGGNSSFPKVPLISISAPYALDKALTILFLLITMSLIFAGWSPLRRRFSFALAAGVLFSGFGLAILNAHRLQAWHWFFLLNLCSCIAVPQHGILSALRNVVSSVYVCSALSRISFQPAGGMTAAIVSQLLAIGGGQALADDIALVSVLCHALTAGELSIGLSLMFPRWRRVSCAGAMMLHVTLLIALGPVGLGHHSAVLVWNVCFVCLLPVLFWGTDAPVETISATGHWRFRAAIAVIWLFPLSGLFGIADNWPSWQLYSSRPESWGLMIDQAGRRALPQRLSSYVGEPAPFSEWSMVRLDRWSLSETGSPMYPQGRFQCSVIAWVVDQLPDGSVFQIEISEPARLFWWNRRYRHISDRGQLQREQDSFIFNAVVIPKKNWQ